MAETSQGLTQTYNRLKDPDCDEPRIVALRRLHEEMDRAVLDAYGWSRIAVPPFCPKTDADRASLEAFEDEVIDALFVLNAARAEEEKRAVPLVPTAKAPTSKRALRAVENQPVVLDLFATSRAAPIGGAPVAMTVAAKPAHAKPPLPEVPTMPSLIPAIIPGREAAFLVVALLRVSGGTMRDLDIARAFAFRKQPDRARAPHGLAKSVGAWAKRIKARPAHPTFKTTVDLFLSKDWGKGSADSEHRAVRIVTDAAPRPDDGLDPWYQFEAALLVNVLAGMSEAEWQPFDVDTELAA
jgi:hypothetical protein